MYISYFMYVQTKATLTFDHRKVIHPTHPITFCASRNDAGEETKASVFKVHWPGCRVWVVGIENRLTTRLHHLCMSSLHYKIQSCLAVGCRPPLANLSAESGRQERTQRHDWPVAPRTRSAPLRIILLVFHDSLPVWSLTVRRVTEILQGLKLRAAAPTTTRFSFHLGAVLPPQKQSNKIVKFPPDQAEGRKNTEHLQEAEMCFCGWWGSVEHQWSH